MADVNPYAPPGAELPVPEPGPAAAWDGTGSLALNTFRSAWRGYFASFPRLLGILLITYLPVDFVFSWYEASYVGEDDWGAAFRIQALLNQWFLLIPDGAIYWMAWNQVRGRECGVSESLGTALRRYWQLWWTRFLMSLSYLTFLLLLVPGVFLTTRWAVSEVSVITEDETGTHAFGRSWALTRNRFWPVFGALLLGMVPPGVLMAIAMTGWTFVPADAWWIDGSLDFVLSLGIAFTLFVAAVLHRNLSEAEAPA